VLVAFSGSINHNGEAFKETDINKDRDGNTISESQLPKTFHKDEFSMLIVADKYQTGFDEPLLHTMFVDKKLNDVKAVQTLSRLNRTCRGKEDTFVLDFVNDAEDIKKSFEPYFECTTLEGELDVNTIYDAISQLRSMYLWGST
ncbi:type I restriction endonuclease subunit R, partial [Acinetobacter baumannii]